MNRWGIPKELEEKVKKRDLGCVYCLKEFNDNSKDKATWEHIDNNAKNISEKNIVLCCASCNASKGTKKLADWLESSYCKQKNINQEHVATIIQNLLLF